MLSGGVLLGHIRATLRAKGLHVLQDLAGAAFLHPDLRQVVMGLEPDVLEKARTLVACISPRDAPPTSSPTLTPKSSSATSTRDLLYDVMRRALTEDAAAGSKPPGGCGAGDGVLGAARRPPQRGRIDVAHGPRLNDWCRKNIQQRTVGTASLMNFSTQRCDWRTISPPLINHRRHEWSVREQPTRGLEVLLIGSQLQPE